MKKEICIAKCNNIGKLILMQFDDDEEKWICLHKETRKEEIKEIRDFLKKYL